MSLEEEREERKCTGMRNCPQREEVQARYSVARLSPRLLRQGGDLEFEATLGTISETLSEKQNTSKRTGDVASNGEQLSTM
jgi:hypothetical protein